MQNTLKKAFTSAVVATTIAWSIGLSALPLAAKAATSGTLVKASTPAVYYVGADMKRYVFPNEKTYKSWYADFSGVQIISDAELASLPIGGNVTYKPGVRMVKITTDPKVYAVDANGTLRWVSTEAAAVALYGSDWNQKIDDVADSFFVNYTLSSNDIVTSADFSPSAATTAAVSINADKGLSMVADGSLTAMMSATQPMGGTIPGLATNVNMVNVDVMNGGSSAVTLDTMTVRRVGIGTSANFAALYAYEGDMRLTTGRTINSSTNEATFGGLNLTLEPGAKKTLKVMADMATATAGNQNAIEVVAISASGASVTGLPVTGPFYTMAGANVGNITIASNGSFVDAKAGSNAKVAEFQLSASSSEDVMLHKVALYYTGTTARENVSNLTLTQAGNVIATASGISSKDLVTFVLATPFKLEKGASRIFQVHADVSGNARAAETIKFHMDNDSDLYAIGATYGYGVGVIRTGYDNTGVPAGDASSLAIDAGQINLTFNGPASKDVAIDGKDIELFNFTMSAQSNVEVRNVRLSLTGAPSTVAGGLIDTTLVGTTGSVANYTDIKLVDTATGAVVGGPLDLVLTGGDTQALVFNSVFNMSSGQTRTFKVTADVANNASLANDTLTATLAAFVAGDIRNLDNNTNVTDIVPATAIVGNAVTVKAATIAASASSTPVAQTYITGIQGAEIGGLILKAGDVADMKVSAITLTPDVPGGGVVAASYAAGIQTASLWNGSTQIGSVQSPNSTTGKLVFTNLNMTVPAGQSLTITLKGNVSSVATAGTYRYGVAATTTDITATDVDGAAKTVTGGAITFNTMTVAAAGTMSLALAADDTETEAGIVVGGSSNVVLAKYKWTAQNEELKVTKLQLQTGTANAVQSLALYDGSTLIAGPVGIDGTGVAEFTGVDFIVGKDTTKTMTVKANLTSVGASGATTGSDIKVTLLTTGYEMRGTSAGSSTVSTTLPSVGNAAVPGNSKIIRKTKPTVSLVSLPSSVLTAGDVTVLRFTVEADAAGDIALAEITANITGSFGGAVTMTSHKLRRTGSVDIASTVTTSGTDVRFALTAEEVIPAGTAKTFDIILTVGGAALGAGDSISSKLVEADTGAITLNAAGAIAAADFVWSDMSVIPHSMTSVDWANGDYVKTLPSDSQTLVK